MKNRNRRGTVNTVIAVVSMCVGVVTYSGCAKSIARPGSAIDIKSKNYLAYLNEGLRLERTGNGIRAKSMYKNAILIMPNSATARIKLAQLDLQLGNDEEARVTFKEAILNYGAKSSYHFDPIINAQFAMLSKQAGFVSEADSAYSRILEKQSEFPIFKASRNRTGNLSQESLAVAHLIVALEYQKIHDKTSTAFHLKESARLDPKQTAPRWTLARMCSALNLKKDCEKYLRLVASSSDSPLAARNEATPASPNHSGQTAITTRPDKIARFDLAASQRQQLGQIRSKSGRKIFHLPK